MSFDLVLGGVGGQGILSIAFVLDNAALKQGLHVKQSEVHGMAQRGGAVSSHVRISDQTIYSDTVPPGAAQLLLSVEPMEALRYLAYLAPEGRVVASTSAEVNIPDYPELREVLSVLLRRPGVVLLDGKKVAKEAGSHRAQNMVLLGAAAPYLPLPGEVLEEQIFALFAPKGEKVLRANLRAFRYGRAVGQVFRRRLEGGEDGWAVLEDLGRLDPATLASEPA